MTPFVSMLLLACGYRVEPEVEPPGAEERPATEILEAGAEILQASPPVGELDIQLVGFHPMKDEPTAQMTAFHFCRQVNEDFAQCVLFDGNAADANLTGVEYIISERLFADLPEEERQYWHPHNGEILSGQLVAPGLPAAAETALMRTKLNSYGKTWHTWATGDVGMVPQEMPLGEPHLAWSFNRDGEADPALVEARDQALGIDTEEIRDRRQGLVDEARPQHGVDALLGEFPRPVTPIPGVVEARRTGNP
jgi:hypothetical protein